MPVHLYPRPPLRLFSPFVHAAAFRAFRYPPTTSRAVGSPPACDGPSIAGPPLHPAWDSANACVCHSAVDADIGLALQSMQAPRIRAPPAAAVDFGHTIAGMSLQTGLDLAGQAAVNGDLGLPLPRMKAPRIRLPPAAPVGSPTVPAGPSTAGMPARPGMDSGAAAAVPDSAATAVAAVAAVADGGIGRTGHRR